MNNASQCLSNSTFGVVVVVVLSAPQAADGSSFGSKTKTIGMGSQEAVFALECSPSKVLDFKLEDGSEPAECVLSLTNYGNESVAFKVKTTKPKRYLVRPNQGVVPPSEKLAVSIVLLAQDKLELLQEFMQTGGCNETNKFMVQALILGAATANSGGAVPTSVWEESKEMVQQKKLVVRFSFPRRGATTQAASTDESLKQASNGIREAVGGGGNTSTSNSTRSRGGAGGGDPVRGEHLGSDGGDMTQDQMWVRATALRQKYDDLVSFTINLTAEKDLIQRSLGATKEELQREQQARKQLEAQIMEPGARRAASVVGPTAPAQNRTGFSLFFVLLVAMVALFAGQWTAANGYAVLFGS